MFLRKARLSVLRVFLSVLLSVTFATRTLSAQPYEVSALRDLMVPARDGIKLGTNVFLPARGGSVVTGRFPAIVERTVYNKDGTPAPLIEYFVSRGYAVVIQDVRGRYRSEGRWRGNRDDGPDGADLLKWIGEQRWSSGKVGTMGTSYSGATQLALAIADAPNLAAMVPVDAMSNVGRYGVRHNGAFELRWLNWILTLGNATGLHATASGLGETPNGHVAAVRAASAPQAVSAIEQIGPHVRDYAASLPLRPGTTPLRFAPDYEAWLIEAMRPWRQRLLQEGCGVRRSGSHR